MIPRLNQSGLLFVPKGWQKAKFIRWLKRIHAWTGFWGAILFLLLGISGMLLNHRDILKIDTGEPQEVSAMNIAVDPALITDDKALGEWAIHEFGLLTEPRPPRREGPMAAAPRTSRFMGEERVEPEVWEMGFNHPDGRLIVEYAKGAASVSVRQEAHNVFGFIKNLHKGSGVGVGWVLFMDSIAGALAAMSITGFLLWTRMHGPRLVAGAIGLGSIALGIFALWPYLL